MGPSTKNAGEQGATSSTDERAAIIETLVAKLELIVEQSGNPTGFDARTWLNRWLHTPLPAFANRLPIDFIDTPDGVVQISAAISRMQSGAFM